uniref:Uncharacterized protein n=1 Tax=Siphoviridae sp. ctnsL8 TaxID=2825666 RepID=A0A8S5PP63_9CAUD|nr:MAG TPA: Protein of unknown function (DUF3935) [Siphoviridae sp. ctnsL8]
MSAGTTPRGTAIFFITLLSIYLFVVFYFIVNPRA